MSPVTRNARTETAPGCADSVDLFQHPLLEEPPSSSASVEVRREYAALRSRASAVCSACPLMASCLYQAVVKHDVAGFVAGTTQRERSAIRARLGVSVEPEDLDSLAGVTRGSRQVNHDEVVRLRQANPHESLETIAHRLGCSLSTVKRHLRRHRDGNDRPQPRRALPTMNEVLAAAQHRTAPGAPRRALLVTAA